MKKIIALILSLILLLSFTSCGEDEVDPNTNIGPNGEINFPIIDIP